MAPITFVRNGLARFSTISSAFVLLTVLYFQSNYALAQEPRSVLLQGPSSISSAALADANDYNSILILGSSASWGENGDVLLVKMNTAMEVVWAKAFGTPYEEFPQRVATFENGDIVVLYHTRNSLLVEARCYLVKLNKDGEVLYSKDLSNRLFYGLHILENGSILLIGDGPEIALLDSTLELISDRYFCNITIIGDHNHPSLVTSRNGLIAIGAADMILVTDSALNPLWGKRINYEILPQLDNFSSTDISFVNDTTLELVCVQGHTGFGIRSTQFTTQGTFLGNLELSSGVERPNDVTRTPLGYLAFSYNDAGTEIVGLSNTLEPNWRTASRNKIYITYYGGDHLIWNGRLCVCGVSTECGINSYNLIISVLDSNNQNPCYVSRPTLSSFYNTTQLFVSPLSIALCPTSMPNSDYTLNNDQFVTLEASTLCEDINVDPFHHKAYPNPASDHFTIEIKLVDPNINCPSTSYGRDFQLVLFDATGRRVQEHTLAFAALGVGTKHTVRVERGNLAPGLYVYTLVDTESKARFYGRIVFD